MVNSFTFCLAPVLKPSASLNHSMRGARAKIEVAWKRAAPATPTQCWDARADIGLVAVIEVHIQLALGRE